jgi:hypothetical protein
MTTTIQAVMLKKDTLQSRLIPDQYGLNSKIAWHGLCLTIIQKSSDFSFQIHSPVTVVYLSKGGNMHLNMVPIQIEDANLEIMARIVKAASRKYNCDVEIDFSNGGRKVVFVGDEEMKPYIAGEVLDIFESKEGDACSYQ